MNGVARLETSHVRYLGKKLVCRQCGQSAREVHRTDRHGLFCKRCNLRELNQEIADITSRRAS